MPRKRTGLTRTDASTPKTERAGRPAKATAAPKTGRRARKAPEDASITLEERRRRIAVAAYYRAESRGFEPGSEIEDWLAAERAVDEELARP